MTHSGQTCFWNLNFSETEQLLSVWNPYWYVCCIYSNHTTYDFQDTYYCNLVEGFLLKHKTNSGENNYSNCDVKLYLEPLGAKHYEDIFSCKARFLVIWYFSILQLPLLCLLRPCIEFNWKVTTYHSINVIIEHCHSEGWSSCFHVRCWYPDISHRVILINCFDLGKEQLWV